MLHLTIQRDSTFDRAVLAAFRWLPASIRPLIQYLWPGYFLPNHLVLKKQKPGWEEEFEHEKAMYARLRSLQGHVIPIYYGEVQCDDGPGIIMEDVKGEVPFGQEKPFLSPDEFRRRLEVSLEAFRSFGLMTDDTKLANNLLLDDKVVFVDLENVWEPDKDDWDFFYKSRINGLINRYKGFLRSWG